MTKITPEHLARQAVVYVRQSTAFQVTQNLESQRRQYALTERASQLGWSDVEVIDDDLGRSGAGTRRPGFERNLVERFFNQLKHFRAVATRYDKLARNFLAGVQLAAVTILLN